MKNQEIVQKFNQETVDSTISRLIVHTSGIKKHKKEFKYWRNLQLCILRLETDAKEKYKALTTDFNAIERGLNWSFPNQTADFLETLLDILYLRNNTSLSEKNIGKSIFGEEFVKNVEEREANVKELLDQTYHTYKYLRKYIYFLMRIEDLEYAKKVQKKHKDIDISDLVYSVETNLTELLKLAEQNMKVEYLKYDIESDLDEMADRLGYDSLTRCAKEEIEELREELEKLENM